MDKNKIAAGLILVFFFVSLGYSFAFPAYFASGIIPNPGHSLSEIQGFFSNDTSLEQSMSTIADSLEEIVQALDQGCSPGSAIRQIILDGVPPGAVACETDDVATGSVTRLETTYSACTATCPSPCSVNIGYTATCTATCPAGYTITGGSCMADNPAAARVIRESTPAGNGWRCTAELDTRYGTSLSGEAICARFV